MTEEQDDYDSPWKKALEWYFEDFMAFFFPDAHGQIDWNKPVEFMDKELQQAVKDAELGRRYADKLGKVWTKIGKEEWVLAHVEVQGEQEVRFDQRMYVYNYRIFDVHGRRVASFAVLADENVSWRPGWFGYELFGCTLSFTFPNSKLSDYRDKWSELEASDNPFATVVMAHLKAQETRRNPQGRYDAKFSLIRRLYERGYARDDIIRLLTFIDWVMRLPQELESAFWLELQQYEKEQRMEYATSVERIGIEKGRQIGLQEGKQEGRQEQALRMFLRVLEYRFGTVPVSVQERVQPLSTQELEELVDITLIAKTREEVIIHLPSLPQSPDRQP